MCCSALLCALLLCAALLCVAVCCTCGVAVWRGTECVCAAVLCCALLLLCGARAVCCVLCVYGPCAGCVGCASACMSPPYPPPPCRRLNQNAPHLTVWPPDAQYRFIFDGAYLYGHFAGRRQNAVRAAHCFTNLTKNAVRVCRFGRTGYSGCVLEGSLTSLFRKTRKK